MGRGGRVAGSPGRPNPRVSEIEVGGVRAELREVIEGRLAWCCLPANMCPDEPIARPKGSSAATAEAQAAAAEGGAKHPPRKDGHHFFCTDATLVCVPRARRAPSSLAARRVILALSLRLSLSRDARS